MRPAEYHAIEDVLGRSHALTDAAEAHGTLAGALCAAADYRLEDWLRELYAEGRTDGQSQQSLREVFDATRTSLLDRGLTFAALLPDDEQPLTDRATALGQWCQGFLYGLGTATIPDVDALPKTAGEIVRDLTAITQVGVDAREAPEANEEAYMELVEFVRVGAQLLYEELEPFRTQAPRPSASEGMLH